MKIISLALVLLYAFPALADFSGLTIGVTDGDTITVLRDHKQVKIRLAEIDAPEKAQPFGKKSKEALSKLVYDKHVRVVELGRDRYKRTIGRVYQGDVDVSAEQVKQGMAWVYRTYSKDKSLLQLEVQAKTQGLGLWADAAPMQPWKWRRAARSDK